ncbi:MAG: DUF4232 domain-containing protein [Nocardioides sp.]
MKIRTIAAAATCLAAAALTVPLPANAGSIPECTNADLTASYQGGDAAMSHVYGRIVLTNTGDRACVTGGYGGLSYVGGGDGTQVGAAADRDAGRVRLYVLKPGDRVRSRVAETSYAPFPKAKCRPRHVDGFRVFIPDATASQFIAHPTTGCANGEVHLISHRPYRR